MAKQRRICLKAVVDEKGRKCVESAVIRDRAGLIKVYIVRGDKRGRILKKIAELPMIKLIRDPSGDLYVASNGDGKIIDVSPTLRTLLELLVDRGYIVPLNMLSRPELQIILSGIIEVGNGFVDAGITFDGIVDPRGVGLDLEEWPERVKILEDIARWVEKAYLSERNRKIALANVAFLLAKTLSPAIRMVNKTFIDHFVWNVGRGGEGKSSLVVYVMLPLLGVDEDINDQLFIYIRGAVRTPEQARNLIALNRMPLILDEQTRNALSRNVDIIMSSAVGSGVIGVHASKYGGGIGYAFKSYRGVIIFTNVHFSEFLREVVREASDYAITRRVIELEWDDIKINQEAFKELPRIKPILGNLDAVWKRHRDELFSTANVKELAVKVLELLEKEYNVDLRIYREAVEEVWRVWENGKTMLVKSEEDLLVERALEVARKLLGETNITSLKLLESIIENPSVYGIKFTYGRNDVEEQEEIKRLRGIICKSVGSYNPQDLHMLCGSSADVKQELYSLDKKLRNYYENGKLFVVIKSRSALCPGTPKRFLGFPERGYSDGGSKFNGYKIPLSRFIEIFIGRTSAREEKEERNMGEKGGNGEEDIENSNTNIGRTGSEGSESSEAIDTAGAIKSFEQLPSNNGADHSKILKSDTAIAVSLPSLPSLPPGDNNISSGFEVLKKALENIEPGCYSEDELKKRLGELYDVVVNSLGIAKENKICLGVEG
ncbi:MAG: hypothetical protein QXP97_07655 [Desulfurococcus sp.]|uniref:hypothetical protein n=1 Tax=Desulfurococcus sp. TaxID=51678 RepID=UPI00316864AB